MGHEVDVVSITRDGEVLYTGDVVGAFRDGYLEGTILEVSFGTRSGNPYFAYYLCPDYYFAVAGGGVATFGGPVRTEEFRSAVSQRIAVFLLQYLQAVLRIDAHMDIIGFDHNRAHTNVLIYVSSLNNWYPVQHNDSEDEDASERKVALVNGGVVQVADVIAIKRLSPSAVE